MISLFLSLLLLNAGMDGAGKADPLPADPVLRTLVQGGRATDAGDHRALIAMAQALRAQGATPADGQDDLAAIWTRQAKDHGVRGDGIAFRGRALGPAYRRGALDAGGSMTVRQLFLAGQRAQIFIAPTQRGASLSMRVSGADGHIYCAKPVGGAQADCAWLPLFTDRYDIVIENGGSGPAVFYLVVR